MELEGMGTRSRGLRIKGSGFGTLLGLAILLMRSAMAFAAASGGGGERELGITVRVYDYAHLRRGTLIAAEKQVAFIFRKAGLAIGWCNLTSVSAESLTDSSCDQPAGPARIEVRIVPWVKVKAGETTGSIQGFAEGNLATVAYHWVDAAHPSGVAVPWEILACVIAHEIGHLLLGPNSHSRTGIMRSRWDQEDLCRASQDKLLFTAQQSELIRAGVRARRVQQEEAASVLMASRK